MSKTILELSQELGVSKTAINKWLTPANRKLYVSKVGNKFAINDTGVSLIRQHFGGKIDNQNANQVGDFNKQLLDTLQAELAAKNEQLAAAQKLLDQQQKLTLQANQQISKLETKLTQLQLPDKPDPDSVKPYIKDVAPQSTTDSQTTTTKSTTTQTKTHWWQFWR